MGVDQAFGYGVAHAKLPLTPRWKLFVKMANKNNSGGKNSGYGISRHSNSGNWNSSSFKPFM